LGLACERRPGWRELLRRARRRKLGRRRPSGPEEELAGRAGLRGRKRRRVPADRVAVERARVAAADHRDDGRSLLLLAGSSERVGLVAGKGVPPGEVLGAPLQEGRRRGQLLEAGRRQRRQRLRGHFLLLLPEVAAAAKLVAL